MVTKKLRNILLVGIHTSYRETPTNNHQPQTCSQVIVSLSTHVKCNFFSSFFLYRCFHSYFVFTKHLYLYITLQLQPLLCRELKKCIHPSTVYYDSIFFICWPASPQSPHPKYLQYGHAYVMYTK